MAESDFTVSEFKAIQLKRIDRQTKELESEITRNRGRMQELIDIHEWIDHMCDMCGDHISWIFDEDREEARISHLEYSEREDHKATWLFLVKEGKAGNDIDQAIISIDLGSE